MKLQTCIRSLERIHRQAGNAYGIGPAMLFNLTNDIIVAQIRQPHMGHTGSIQRFPNESGNRTGGHGVLIFFRGNNIRRHIRGCCNSQVQTLLCIIIQRDFPVFQCNYFFLGVNISPGQRADFFSGHSLKPRQTQNSAYCVAGVFFQKPPHGIFVRTVDIDCHKCLPLRQNDVVMR